MITSSLTRPLTSRLTRAIAEAGVGGSATSSLVLQNMVLAGSITPAAPMVPIGDSHTDNGTGAQYLWDRLKVVRNQPGEGLEGVAAAAIVPMGNNGQSLASYNTGAGTNTFAAAMALAPSVTVSCWLTNDVRTGGLGLTVAAIRAAGVALLNQHVANIKAARPTAKIVLRIPAPYLTVNISGFNYITDGTNINPAGLAQIYTDGVRLAHYDVRTTHPDVLIYDPQARLFGTESPTALGSYFADQIHQNQPGYEAEADDFAAWVNAAIPYNAALTTAALASNQYAPWLDYSRAVEDGSRFVQISYGQAITATSGNTFFDLGPTVPGVTIAAISAYDVIEEVGASKSFVIPPSSSFSASAANTRVSLGGGATVPATAVALTKARIYRQTQSGDAAVNAILNGSASYRRTGRVVGGAASYMDIAAYSLAFDKATQAANLWAAEMLAGDKIYVEGRGGTPITLTSNFAPSGAALRLTGLSGFDWSTLVGRIVVVFRA